MKASLDEKGLDRNPHHFASNSWYYEESDGLKVYVNGAPAGTIKLNSIRAFLKRHDAAKVRKAKK